MRSADTDTDGTGAQDAESSNVTALVRAAMETGLRHPKLPDVAIALGEIVGRGNADLREAEIVVSRDPSVAAKIVAIANAPSNRNGSPVRSLGSAISRLGIVAVRDAAFLVAAHTRLFKAPGYGERMASLFEAAQIAGLIAREVCSELGMPAEHAYLCGLLHDVGEAIVLSAIGDLRRIRGRGNIQEDVEAALAECHAEAGARACEEWGMPAAVVDAVRFHHHPARSRSDSRMADVIAVVDVLLHHVGVGAEARPLSRSSEPIFDALNLDLAQVRELALTAERIALSESTSA